MRPDRALRGARTGATRAALRTVLRACVAEHDWSRPVSGVEPAVAATPARALARLAAHHGVEAMCHLSLRGNEAAEPLLLGRLARAHRSAVLRHVRVMADLPRIGDQLDRAAVRWMLVKGPVLAEAVYPQSDLRSYVDVDVIVRPADLARAVEALEAVGGCVLDDWGALARRRAGQVHLSTDMGTLVDLHWHLLNRSAVRRSLNVPSEGLFARRRFVGVGAIATPTLGVTDTLVHLCVHAALSGATRLLWLKDVERAIDREPPDWREVVGTARDWGASPLVGSSLARAAALAGAAVPPGVVDHLMGSAWRRRLLSGADLAWPPELAHGDRSVPAILVQMQRDGVRATARAARARVTRRSASRSASRAPAGPAARDRFLAAVRGARL